MSKKSLPKNTVDYRKDEGTRWALLSYYRRHDPTRPQTGEEAVQEVFRAWGAVEVVRITEQEQSACRVFMVKLAEGWSYAHWSENSVYGTDDRIAAPSGEVAYMIHQLGIWRSNVLSAERTLQDAHDRVANLIARIVKGGGTVPPTT